MFNNNIKMCKLINKYNLYTLRIRKLNFLIKSLVNCLRILKKISHTQKDVKTKLFSN